MSVRTILALLTACLVAGAAQAAPRRVLHVSLYPYIPDVQAAAFTLKQGFERLHPDVVLDITLNANYYSPDPKDGGVLYEDADVHEVDSVFMQDFLNRHLLQPIGASGFDPLTPVARQAATSDGILWAAPQWICTDFIVYRSDHPAIAQATSLATLATALSAAHGLLLDMHDPGQLGELYLSTLVAASGGDPEAALARLTATPDPVILTRLRRILSLEPAGLGRDGRYAQYEGFYARQFARGVGAAFVGYSELTHDALDEAAEGCRREDHCVTPAELRVAPFPFADGQVKPNVWVDMFAIDREVHGQTLSDARNFIRYATSLAAYRALLIPRDGEAPRYVMPASETAFDDPAILRAAPLYSAFHAIVARGVAVSVPNLDRRLHLVAARIDVELPGVH